MNRDSAGNPRAKSANKKKNLRKARISLAESVFGFQFNERRVDDDDEDLIQRTRVSVRSFVDAINQIVKFEWFDIDRITLCFTEMQNLYSLILFLALSLLVGVLNASSGDADPHYKACIVRCEKTGCIGDRCFQQCKLLSDDASVDRPWYMQEPMYVQWKQWDCRSDCRYHCMLDREREREQLGLEPVKYHGKWPFTRFFGIQEPVSVVLSVLNLTIHFHGWLSYFILLYYKLPLRPHNGKPYYEYAGLLHVYGLLALNAWFWSAVFHIRDLDLTEKLDYSSAVALLGYGLIVAILRTFSVRDEAARVMVAAPLIAFVSTHILYLNFYKFDYGLNMKVCVSMGVAQLLLWSVWVILSRHPSRLKLWVVIVGTSLALLLEIYDFPPYKGYVDAHALWHAATIPLTYLWWSFFKDDAEFRTTNLMKKAK